MVYYVVLSPEGDLLQTLGNDSWKATFNLSNATRFNTIMDAQHFIREFDIKFFYQDLRIQGEQ